MQPRLDSDLGQGRGHTGPRPPAAAAAVNAEAYPIGHDIFFAAGRYSPHSAAGRRLLAHELSHTVQQSGGSAGTLSQAAMGVQRQPTNQGTTTDTETKKPKTDQVTVPVPPALLSRY